MSKTSFMKVDRLVRVMTGGAVVTDRLVEKRTDKITDAVAELAQEIKRLDQAKIKSPLLEKTYQDLLARQNMVANIPNNADRSRELDLVKADARAAAALGPILVDGRLAQNEIFRCSLLLQGQLDLLKHKGAKNEEATGLQQTFDGLSAQYEQAKNITDIKQQTDGFQRVRSAFRSQLEPFQSVVSDILEVSELWQDMKNNALEAYASALQAVQKVKPGEGRAHLEQRLTKCKNEIYAGAMMDGNAWFHVFKKQIDEAKRISALSQQNIRTGGSQADVVLGKVNEAKRLAERNPSGAEAIMMSALGGESTGLTAEQRADLGKQEFERMLKKAYEQVAVSGSRVDQLSPGEVVALHNYTTQDYELMNKQLILGYEGGLTGENYKKKIEAVTEALKKLPSYEGGMTLRGEWLWKKDGHKAIYFLGNTFAIKPLWSTGVKMCFATPIQISVFGKGGKDVAAMSDKPNETEVLFPPGTKFKVTAYREEGKGRDFKIFMTVEEV